MRANRRHILSLAAGLALVLGATAASAATVVKVDLWDKGADTPMATGQGYDEPGADMAKATMGIKVSPASAPAGRITFEATDSSKDQIHEMIVMYLADPSKQLPYIADESRVDEDKAGDKGEVSELDPGQSGSLTVTLQPGKYLLICNVPGHFEAGMWAEFTVTK